MKKVALSLRSDSHADQNQMKDIMQWKNICKNIGFSQTDIVKVYGEMPAPTDNVFPFENEILQWMGEYVVTSRK